MSTVAELAKLAPVPAPTGASKRPIRQSLLSVREKIDAIDRVHEGESKAAVARDIGVPESTLRGWCKTEEKLRSLARACEGSDTPPSDLDKDQDPYSPDTKRFRVENENHPKSVNLTTGAGGGGAVTAATGAEVDEALWFWLKQQQQQVGLSANERFLEAKVGANGHESSGWFWRWYKQYGGQSQPLPLAERSRSPPTPHSLAHTQLPMVVPVLQPVLQPATVVAPSASPERDTYEAPLSLVKNDRCHATLENNNVPVSKIVESEEEEDDEPPETAAEALKHGERFLRWLDCCSDPSVTAVQILQFRYLLNNVRACVDRRRAHHVKTKEKSRRK